jgi:hypothetical protein
MKKILSVHDDIITIEIKLSYIINWWKKLV